MLIFKSTIKYKLAEFPDFQMLLMNFIVTSQFDMVSLFESRKKEKIYKEKICFEMSKN